MRKTPKKDKEPDRFERLLRRNWIICIVSLGLIMFFMFVFPRLA